MPLSPEQEQQLVDAITALDWHFDPVARARRKIAAILTITDIDALAVLQDLMKRWLVELRPEHSGSGGPLQSKCVRPDQGAGA
jgi:hypothetical protein